jgi:putative transposase
MGLTVLKTPVRCPQANAFCERLIGTVRRECLDWLVVLNERHLRSVLRQWVAHYNQGRPHASLGPGIPDVPLERLARLNGHQIPDGHRVIAAPILAGLHHEYRLGAMGGLNRGKVNAPCIIAEHNFGCPVWDTSIAGSPLS